MFKKFSHQVRSLRSVSFLVSLHYEELEAQSCRVFVANLFRAGSPWQPLPLLITRRPSQMLTERYHSTWIPPCSLTSAPGHPQIGWQCDGMTLQVVHCHRIGGSRSIDQGLSVLHLGQNVDGSTTMRTPQLKTSPSAINGNVPKYRRRGAAYVVYIGFAPYHVFILY
jgi:hypothetical protein